MGPVQDNADAWDTLENVYMPAADAGNLPMRLLAMVPLPTWYASASLHTSVTAATRPRTA